jgi:hypothetical protein
VWVAVGKVRVTSNLNATPSGAEVIAGGAGEGGKGEAKNKEKKEI